MYPDEYLFCFNPCFNGTMYKNSVQFHYRISFVIRFNPCFNGTMYKNMERIEKVRDIKVFQSLF